MDVTNNYVEELVKLYTQHMDRDYAEWSENYLRNQFAFLGIRTPIRRKLTKQFFREYGVPTKENLKDIIFILWERSEREYQKAALDILEKVKKELTPDDIPWLSSLLVKKSWWDTVDVLSPHIMGNLFTIYPELIAQYADQWIVDDNFWLQRSALLYQLYYKKRTDEKRLFQYILSRADSDEFFVQKAIGWVLREYAKTNPVAVRDFVSFNDLKPLSRREALKNL
ncbi:DNA alkylation repair protein [Cutibacterium acnes]|uniref:DNA alkylation repair protein n=1 Tax=Niallia sp. MER TA 168 TaxID=2939568 RepID=UPI000E397808|nr:DNA alkylation repair protein [Niallia sp. MER TA 168]MCM3363424.1 DNA alkylation repair protein [Niallia sp. MER TA 168]REB76106.1 DNA alkylation repair protein [Cutibacterium acnes]